MKALGLIDYDLRRDLSTGQKSRITKLMHEFGHVVKHPEDFEIKRVGKNQRQLLSESGFKVTPKSQALIPLGKYEKATLTKNSIIYTKGKITDETYLNAAPDFFQTVNKLGEIKLKKNQYFSVRIGDHNPFNRYFKNVTDLNKYLELWQPKDAEKYGLSATQAKLLKEKLVSRMSIVTYTTEKKTWGNAKRRKESLKRKLQ